MPIDKLDAILAKRLSDLEAGGGLKGKETVITGVKPAQDGHGPRWYLEGQGSREFLRMNSNSYLGLSLDRNVVHAEEAAAAKFGAGPGAVRFISGTCRPHVELEQRLARFHGRQAAMIFSAAYATVMGVLPQLIDRDTIVLSDALNHNCIINAVRLSRPAAKIIYNHLDMPDLEKKLRESVGKGKRAVVVTDGIFSMRGDYAPLDILAAVCNKYQAEYEEGIITVVDDSHGVGAFGKTGRGTEEFTSSRADVLVATLGKALGVNGGYVVGSPALIRYLRETSPFYVYSNPITPSEASAATQALEILAGPSGLKLLQNLRRLTKRFETGLKRLGHEVLSSEHPIVPLMVRDTRKTSALVEYLFDNTILATGLNFPVVPKNDEEIRFQIAADLTERDIDYVLDVLAKFR